jgi:hypothetical protein
VTIIVCSACGAKANASCNCGVAYQPKSVRAAEAVRANPEKSNRSIAAELGVSPDTVDRARKQLPDDQAVKRTGLDGKARQQPIHWQRRVHPDVVYPAAVRGVAARTILEEREAQSVGLRTITKIELMCALMDVLKFGGDCFPDQIIGADEELFEAITAVEDLVHELGIVARNRSEAAA